MGMQRFLAAHTRGTHGLLQNLPTELGDSE